MRRVLVVTWALGTASGVLLGLFGVQLVSSRFSTSRVSPLSHPEVLHALQAARSLANAPDSEVALPVIPAPDTADPSPSPPTDAAPARPSAEATSSPAQASPASSLPRPGATVGSLVDPTASAAATPPATTATAPPAPEPPATSTSATTATTSKTKSKDRNSGRSSTTSSSTTTTTAKKTTATTTAPPPTKDQTQTQGATRTISSKGGIVTVRWVDGKVEIRQARPNPGWEVKVYNYGPDNVVVKFTRGRYTSWVWAGYRNGTPASAVMECAGPSREDCRPA
jgi:hypothetical protein